MHLSKFIVLLASALLAACQAPAVDTSQAAKFNLSSPAFQDSALIPKVFTCQGNNHSPELTWSDFPAATKSYALIMDDPDAPGGTFTHWVLFDIPAGTTGLAEGDPSIGINGVNSAGRTGYMGPCPPSGIHRYYFRLYALDVPLLNLKPDAGRTEVEAALKSHVIGAAALMGRYGQATP